jgi:isocitrate/isopropylmalate dehydrogenase
LDGSRLREKAERDAQQESSPPYLGGYPRQTVGGRGFGCSGNLGQKLVLFEPTHGSAPKYAGQFKVNPIATILAAKMMLKWLGETGKGAALEGAVAAVIREGKVRTYDMGGNESTLDMAKAIAGKL